eukprot:COSAG05_NODE_61_length_23137_cov_22.080693_18_plen_105_part_00
MLSLICLCIYLCLCPAAAAAAAAATAIFCWSTFSLSLSLYRLTIKGVGQGLEGENWRGMQSWADYIPRYVLARAYAMHLALPTPVSLYACLFGSCSVLRYGWLE